MAKSVVIDKPMQTFDDQTDFSRNNPARQQWGKQNSTSDFHLANEYDTQPPTPEPPSTEVPVPPAPKFTHKLANGTLLEAESFEALAAQIEKAAQPQTPAPVPQILEFEDKLPYQPIEFKPKELSLQEQANILNVWKENPQKALRMLEEAEYGHPMETILQRLSRAEQRELERAQMEAGVEFMGECEDYNPTATNGKKLTEFLAKEKKPITKQNLKVAFLKLSAEDKTLLRKVDEPTPTPEPEDPTLVETPPPPTVVPSNQGRVESQPQNVVDVAKFASMTLKQQQEYFATLKRRA